MAQRKGKYSGVIDHLPRMPGVDPERRDVVEVVKQQIRNASSPSPNEIAIDNQMEEIEENVRMIIDSMKRTTAGRPWAAEFARAYAQLRSIRARIDTLSGDLGVLIEAYQWLMVEQMEVEGVTSLRLTNGQPVSTFLEPYAQVVDREQFRVWCIKQGFEKQMQLPWQTANSITKQMLLAGEAEPPGVTCWAKTKVRLGSE